MSQSTELSNLLNAIKDVDQDSFPSEADRHLAILEARKLVARLEKPWDTLLHSCWGTSEAIVALKVCSDLNVFKLLDSGPKKCNELAKATGSHGLLLIRVLRHLASENLLVETGPETYGHTKVSREISQAEGSSPVDFIFDFGWKGMLSFPEYMKKTNYKNPTDVRDGNWQYATNNSAPFFGPDGWLAAHPEAAANFSRLMVGYNSQRQNWVEVFPTETLLDGDAGDDEVLMVDVGGNAGEDLRYLMLKHPETAGRLIVQDLEMVISGATVPEGIKPMAYDFFTPQPVKNTRAYFFHSIFIDWPDAECLKICQNLRPSMGSNSRLLINDIVLKPSGNSWHATAVDMLMMQYFGSGERTEEKWHELLAEGGFKIVKIHPGRLESVIEAVPV